jgi:hypothetical protein
MFQCGYVDAAHIAVDPYHGRQPGGEMKVGSVVLDAKREQLGNVHKSILIMINWAIGVQALE